MPDRAPDPRPVDAGAEHPWSTPQDAEPEPDWAQEIRDRRKARGDRLKQIFDGFDDAERPTDAREPPA